MGVTATEFLCALFQSRTSRQYPLHGEVAQKLWFTRFLFIRYHPHQTSKRRLMLLPNRFSASLLRQLQVSQVSQVSLLE